MDYELESFLLHLLQLCQMVIRNLIDYANTWIVQFKSLSMSTYTYQITDGYRIGRQLQADK